MADVSSVLPRLGGDDEWCGELQFPLAARHSLIGGGLVDSGPFRITLRIKAPYIPPAHIPTLDGLVWGAAVRVFGRPPLGDEIPLVLDTGVYRASSMVVPGGLHDAGQVPWYRSIVRDGAAIPLPLLPDRGDKDLTALRDSKGPFKNLISAYPSMLPPASFMDDGSWVVHFFGVGDGERTAWLLRHLPGIGRKASRGYGTLDVSGDAITVCPSQDYSWVCRGRPMRPLPTSLWSRLPDADQSWLATATSGAVAPPYGLAGAVDRVPCVSPDSSYLPEVLDYE